MLWICFRGNDFANIKKFLPKHFVETLWYESFFEKRILQPWKIFVQKILFKMFGSNLFSKKLFWSHKKFGNKKNLLKIFGNYQFSGKWFCNHKNVRPKIFCSNFGRYLLSRKWFCNHKNFEPKILLKIFGIILFSRKWICNYKTFSSQTLYWTFLVLTCFRGNDFATTKHFGPKTFVENVWYDSVFEEMILKQ